MTETTTPETGPDWTVDPETGRTNSSPLFRNMCTEVARLLGEGGGHVLDPHWIASRAALIVAQLAHVHHLAPVPPEIRAAARWDRYVAEKAGHASAADPGPDS